MNLTEKISYIKGLAEGLNLDESKPEVKVINAIVELLDDMAYSVSDMEELYDDLSAQVDEIDQDLAEVTCGACGQKLNVSEDVLLEGEIECPNCGELLEFDFSDLFDEDGCCSEDGCTCGCCDVEDEDVE